MSVCHRICTVTGSALVLCSILTTDVSAQSAPSVAVAPVSGAQLVVRRTLLERAQAAARTNDHAQALALALQAAAIENSPSLRMFLAQQQQALGQHVEAMENAEFCLREATRNSSLERRDIMITECRRLSTVSQSHIVLLTLNTPAHTRQGFCVTVGNRSLTDAESHSPIALNPGPVVLTISAPGVAPQTETLDGTAGLVRSVSVDSRFSQENSTPSGAQSTGPLGVTQTANSRTNSSGANSGTAADAHTAVGSPTMTSSATTLRSSGAPVRPLPINPPRGGLLTRVGAGPWVVLSAGAASFLSAGLFFALRNGQFGHCMSVGAEIICDTDADAEQWRMGRGGDPYTYNDLTNVSIAVGAAATVGGLIWFTVNAVRAQTVERPSRRSTAWFVLPLIQPQTASVAIQLGAVL